MLNPDRYFINDNDQIKKISDPEQDFQFKINKNSRWNEAQREAMNGGFTCSPFLQRTTLSKPSCLQIASAPLSPPGSKTRA